VWLASLPVFRQQPLDTGQSGLARHGSAPQGSQELRSSLPVLRQKPLDTGQSGLARHGSAPQGLQGLQELRS
jgi:hypothetical protein